MSAFINNISNKNNIDESIKEKIKVISDFHYYIFNKLCFNSSLMQNNEIVKYNNLIKLVINFFLKCIAVFQNIENQKTVDESSLVSIIRTYDSFFINISMPKDFLLQNNHNNSCFFIDIIFALWQIISYQQFNALAKNELKKCYNNAIQYNSNIFCNTLGKCLSQNKKFNPGHIKIILEYIHYFVNDTDKINKLLAFIIETVQGKAELDIKTFQFFELILMKEKQRLKKVNK